MLNQQSGDQKDRMKKVDQAMLEWLTPFLLEFREETKTLEGDNTGQYQPLDPALRPAGGHRHT